MNPTLESVSPAYEPVSDLDRWAGQTTQFSCMKTITVCTGVLVFTALLYSCWSVAYSRGFNRGIDEGFTNGARAELACWELEPVLKSDGPVQEFVGRRDLSIPLGGRKREVAEYVDSKPFDPRTRLHNPVNSIPADVLP